MPNIEIHGHDLEESTAIQAMLRKHLHHQPIGEDSVITIVPDRCLEVARPKHAPFLRIFVTQDDDVEEVLQAVNSCPFLETHRTHDIEVVQLHAFYPHKK